MSHHSEYFAAVRTGDKSVYYRPEEVKVLKGYLSDSGSVVLMGHHHVGKRKLFGLVMDELNSASGVDEYYDVSCDLSPCFNSVSVERRLLEVISRAACKMVQTSSDARLVLERAFEPFYPDVGVDHDFQYVMEMEPRGVGSDVVLVALGLLDALARRRHVRIAIYVNAVDVLAEFADGDHQVEWQLRRAITVMTNVSIVFSSSKRLVGMELFCSPNRPLYLACKELQLGFLSEEDCQAKLERVNAECGFQVEIGVTDRIFEATQGHPVDFAALCQSVYESASRRDKYVTVTLVNQCWARYISGRPLAEARVLVEHKLRSKRQIEVSLLFAIAQTKAKYPFGAQFIKLVGSQTGTVRRNLDLLLRNGEIVVSRQRHMLTQPSMGDALSLLSEGLMDEQLVRFVASQDRIQ